MALSSLFTLVLFVASICVAFAAKGEYPTSVIPIVFLFSAVAICCCAMHLISVYRESIPYTVVVFLLGVALAGLADAADNSLSTFGSSLDEFVNMDAYLLLYAFLPVLLFGEAMNLNWHHVQGIVYGVVITMTSCNLV